MYEVCWQWDAEALSVGCLIVSSSPIVSCLLKVPILNRLQIQACAVLLLCFYWLAFLLASSSTSHLFSDAIFLLLYCWYFVSSVRFHFNILQSVSKFNMEHPVDWKKKRNVNSLSQYTYCLFLWVYFLSGFACLSRPWPWVFLSSCSLSVAAALLALIISNLRYPLCVCICFTISSCMLRRQISLEVL